MADDSLSTLIEAGVVTHSAVLADPSEEDALLRAALGVVDGPLFRLGPGRFAFRPAEGAGALFGAFGAEVTRLARDQDRAPVLRLHPPAGDRAAEQRLAVLSARLAAGIITAAREVAGTPADGARLDAIQRAVEALRADLGGEASLEDIADAVAARLPDAAALAEAVASQLGGPDIDVAALAAELAARLPDVEGVTKELAERLAALPDAATLRIAIEDALPTADSLAKAVAAQLPDAGGVAAAIASQLPDPAALAASVAAQIPKPEAPLLPDVVALADRVSALPDVRTLEGLLEAVPAAVAAHLPEPAPLQEVVPHPVSPPDAAEIAAAVADRLPRPERAPDPVPALMDRIAALEDGIGARLDALSRRLDALEPPARPAPAPISQAEAARFALSFGPRLALLSAPAEPEAPPPNLVGPLLARLKRIEAAVASGAETGTGQVLDEVARTREALDGLEDRLAVRLGVAAPRPLPDRPAPPGLVALSAMARRLEAQLVVLEETVPRLVQMVHQAEGAAHPMDELRHDLRATLAEFLAQIAVAGNVHAAE